ncbi:flagellar biosynthesis protein FlhF [Panacagrimonas perspica]|uniref:Flagellar biosynthesis protein FlhF n=1 Tax=Panacagrimonas perspica TaxID=381431 RepID=A0A4V3URG9_9GAMM|nr:flagellar biosynthesis protein FlhF [Panacagrimonas perspica]TDU25809.1 flagellar biosynthesis protein FlhF [Panacagrimonas perspica]THD02821.1 flagellar biosynthesis protein FlhF [Panacagrimonas perspica]
MKIKRFIAPTMRDAMRLVREEQGPDAVILSNRRLENGIEVVAATDYDAALVQQAAQRVEPIFEERVPVRAVEAQIVIPAPVAAPAPPPVPTVAVAAPAPRVPAQDPAIAGLKDDMQALRRLMEQQVAGMAWNDMKTRNPVRADVVRRLLGLGLELKLAREIASEIPEGTDADRARFLPMALLARRMPTFKHEWLDATTAPGNDGRHEVIALVGATGVGKTTTIAKLAARYVQHWGLRDVALITTDHFRIGAQEQLFTYGRLLGVPVLTADNQRELCLALDKLKDRKLVLIDTAGMSPRDQNLQKQFAMLSGLPVPNRTALVLSAASQIADLDDQYRRFAAAAPSAVILTKLDEATRVGAAISAITRHAIPLAYVTDGQRVPEDLSAARPDQLVLRAVAATRAGAAPPDDDELSYQFAGAAHG